MQLVTITILRKVRSCMSQQEKQINANSNNNSSIMDAEILEQGDIYFFYRPKKAAEEVKGIEDVRRFFMVTAPEQGENNNNNNIKTSPESKSCRACIYS